MDIVKASIRKTENGRSARWPVTIVGEILTESPAGLTILGHRPGQTAADNREHEFQRGAIREVRRNVPDTKARALRDVLDVMLTEMGFELASGDAGTHFQTWTRVSTDMTVHRQGDDIFVETTSRRAYPVATVEHFDLENVLTRALLHAHDPF